MEFLQIDVWLTLRSVAIVRECWIFTSLLNASSLRLKREEVLAHLYRTTVYLGRGEGQLNPFQQNLLQRLSLIKTYFWSFNEFRSI